MMDEGDDMATATNTSTIPRRSRMTRLEKRLVNSDRKSRGVASQLEDMLATFEPAPGFRYLDVGCGNGAATRAVAATFGLEATGVDVDPEQIAIASATRGDSNVRFLEADATSLPFPDEAFDIVASSKATHHIPRWD